MTSYELLELLEYMDEEGALKSALRGGEYSEARSDIRHLANEVARLRATMHAVHGGQSYDPPLLLSRAELKAQAEEAEATTERREDFYGLADRTPVEEFNDVGMYEDA